MDRLIKDYLKSKEFAWSDSTKRSESSRLYALSEHITGDPEVLWTFLLSQKPYTRVTSYTRVTCLYDWAIDEGRMQGPNPYKKFRRDNARQFKNVYTRNYPKISFEEAERRLRTIPESSIRDKCLELLKNGLRFTESFTRDADNYITGKGGKRRKAFGPRFEGISEARYSDVRSALGKIGLKPHDLRKLFATKLYRKGLDPVDVTKVLGWESFETAKSYIAPKKDEELDALING